MKSNVRMGIILVVLVILITALIDATQKKPVKWGASYSPKDKNPYGTYILAEEFNTIFPKGATSNESILQFFEKNDSNKVDDKVLFLLDNHVTINDSLTLSKMFKFLEKGGDIFISSSYMYNNQLLDSFNIKRRSFEVYEYENITNDTINKYIQLELAHKIYRFDKLNDLNYLTIDTNLPVEVLASGTYRNKIQFANAIRIPYQKGNLYVMAEPIVFTNYYLLQKKNFEYTQTLLSVFKDKKVYWLNESFGLPESPSPMRYILSERSFKNAWYLLLLGLVLIFVFRIKRIQKAIPIVTPEPNLTKDFVKTISNLYYENGTPEDIIEKKINYFFYQLRKHFHIQTDQLNDEHLLKLVEQKSQMSAETVHQYFKILQFLKNKTPNSKADLKQAHFIIEELKSKLNL